MEETSEIEPAVPPSLGMEFVSESEVREYYNNYAQSIGFGTIKIRSKNDDEGKLKYFSLGCCRYGKVVSKTRNSFFPRATSKTGCEARINIIVRADGICVINFVHLDHNHILSPKKVRYFRCNKKLNDNVKRRLALNDMSGISISKNYHSCVVEAGGYENLTFGYNEARAFIAKARKLRLGSSDAQALGEYFISSQARNSNFFYAIDLDDDSRIRNVFWADARCRAAYECFNDVITFDTTYLTNRYDMPFAPFVGVNHHGHSILLGCGLVSNEDVDTFSWLFTTWLRCMFGRHPKAIITDQCRAIKAAVAKVFPSACHRLCLWHIMKKIPAKLGSLEQYKPIKKRLKNIVYDSLRPDEFDEKWRNLIEEYKLHQNLWLTSLYEERHSWAPVFVKHKFWAGMSTTQRSESMNAFFDGYVHSQTTLRQFVEQYDSALKDKMEKESNADFASFNLLIPTISVYPIEQQFQDAYTNEIFKLLQDEMRALIYCNATYVRNDDMLDIFEVTEERFEKGGSSWKELNFDVYYDEVNQKVNCLCCLFEIKGILCRHALAVLIKKHVHEVNSCYVLDRWRKDIKRGYQAIKRVYEKSGCDEERRRHNSLSQHFFEVQQLGSQSDDKHDFLIKVLQDAKVKLLAMDSACTNTENVLPSSHMDHNGSVLQSSPKEIVLRTPLKVRTKGRPPMKRKVSKAEQIAKKFKRKTQIANLKGTPNLNVGQENDGLICYQKKKYSREIAFSGDKDSSTPTIETEAMTHIVMSKVPHCEDMSLSNPTWQNMSFGELLQQNDYCFISHENE